MIKPKIVRKVPVKKPKVKTIAKLKVELQRHFNLFIRTRDIKDNLFTCISCQSALPATSCQAGHWFGVKKYNHMRYIEENVNGQCQYCNGFNHESLIFYTINLIKKIGKEKFNELLIISQQEKKEFTREELYLLIDKYKKINKQNERNKST